LILEEDVKEHMKKQVCNKMIIFYKMYYVNLDSQDAQTIPNIDAQNTYKIFIFLMITVVSTIN
jgi:hypothetical protein